MENNEELIMPSEEAIKKMNEEYSILFSRKSFLEECIEKKDTKLENNNICNADFNIIAKAYCLECDMSLLLDYLMNKARLNRTRKIIYEIIKIKIKNKNRLSKIYYSSAKTSLNYEPNAKDDMSYEALCEELLYKEATLLSLCEKASDGFDVSGIILSEHSSVAMFAAILPR